ncbi:transposase IS66 [Magnetococcus marinus MC-1]|uniref:Transposase IS66 n=1 Tax=Magnetococcus marinus (strain ATCC BAA-1437 / JCM 17883 / MC-1) TaxID=156889 RepID=A0L4F5_MAGMM|nr:IS66 family transposase [Magnetococcus marinus]ABK42848.1 transposase IS66 [Magnetococcus marinus MC-1]ABK42999.1 transposase IS66 [Magnetococcus marinus MC-1]ABK43177.1 transposase IS66 [Magnetococcus marinus MC-1]ABK43183.1 transposase IS66 [Magnetococcus marinus MC-1]ABK43198.1 transposase IS66 [Magnetococcus marinus MC-1]
MKTLPKTLPDDPAALREIILSLQAENVLLQDKSKRMEHEAQLLREKLNILIAKRFGRSSEKSDPRQLGLFDEAEVTAAEEPEEDAEEIQVPAHSRKVKSKGRKPLPEWLPRVDIIHELPESALVCGLDGHHLVEIGRETSEQLDIIPAKVQVLRHIQIKYGCPHCKQGVKTAPTPKRPIPKALATAALLAHVAVSKYADGLPLYRQGAILTRAGIDVCRTTLANWMIQCGQLVQPLINLMRDKMLDYDILQMDETTIQVLKEKDKVAASNSYMWVQRGGPPGSPVILFDYDPTRGAEVPKRLLAGYKGWLQTDGYAGYLGVGAQEDVILMGCFAHARRQFDEAIKALGKSKKGKIGKAGQALSLIRKLYAVEKDLREEEATPERRYKVRQERSRPIIDELKTWLEDNRAGVLPKSKLGEAMGYLTNQWSSLIRYLDDGRLEIDNNRAENAIRPFVIGRKNWLFSNSVRGAKASANLYSLIETAKANGWEPFVYLTKVFEGLATAQTVDEFDLLLPWNLKSAAEPAG